MVTMHGFFRYGWVLLLAPSWAACSVDINGDDARLAGPLDDEVNAVTYWRVTDSSATVEQCTDAAQWSDAVTAPEFKDNSFLMYKVLEGKKEALMQSCDTTSASSCSDDKDGATWSIDQHTLSYQSDPVTISGDAKCDYLLQPTWTLVDKGETADWTVDLVFQAHPDKSDCVDFDAAVKKDSTNGHGILDCRIQLKVALAFEKSEKP